MKNPVSLPCIPVWQIYNIPQIKFRIIPEELVKGEKKSMTMNEFGEIREAWTELMTIYDEIDALSEPADITELAGSDAYAAQRVTAR
jgi:hypothetical protein